jgi:signal transduction histidine kinase
MTSESAQLSGRRASWRRALTASGRRKPASGWSAGVWVADAALFAAAALLGALSLRYLWHSHGAVLDALDLAFGVLACLALWIRRSRPTAMLAVIAAAAFSPLAIGAALVAICSAATHTRGRILAAAVFLAVAGSIVFPLVNPAVGELIPVKQAFPAVVVPLIAFVWGLYLRARREQVASLRERAERLEADQQRSAELARQAERRRIAREMHDVLAHRLSLLSVYAGALEFRPDASAAEITRAAEVIRTSAAAALDDLREVITVLRDDADDTAGAPQPTLAQLPALIEESRAAGMTLRAHIDLHDAGSLPAGAGRTAYRGRAGGADQRAQARARRPSRGDSHRQRPPGPARRDHQPPSGRHRGPGHAAALRDGGRAHRPGRAGRARGRCLVLARQGRRRREYDVELLTVVAL